MFILAKLTGFHCLVKPGLWRLSVINDVGKISKTGASGILGGESGGMYVYSVSEEWHAAPV